MRGSRLATLAVALAIMPMVAHAEECVPETAQPEVDVALATGSRYYVDNDCIPLLACDFGLSIWVYEETNGVDGLQRDDATWGSCGNGDTTIF